VKYWYRRGALAWLLWPASLAFGVVAALRRLAYRLRLARVHRAGVPVIVVGNLTAGGSGKTPLVLWIADFLKASGWKPGIVSRGYGGAVREPRAVTIASEPAEVGDEPVLLARRSGCPVWVAPDRAAACLALRRQNPECNVIVLDDGLQHYALARDIEIAVVDARGFGNGFLLPAGPLREPRSRLRSVHAVVAHGAAGVGGYAMRLEGSDLVRLADAREVRPAKSLAGQKVHAVAGIGDPNRFFLHLAKLGPKVAPHPFPDHYPFAAADLEFGDDAPVVMTEKDAVKCKRFAKAQHWVLPVRAALDPAFGDWLLKKLSQEAAQ
jgi:tetraacyldisaccharide 4'-kinase